jgi:UDP-N-acetyl-D-glucosamine/UDP-N-acetyl-D-galactosamine dehydrogenase
MKIVIIGLGYVGLPLATALANYRTVVGYDIFEARVQELKAGIDRNGELTKEELSKPLLTFSTQESDFVGASLYIVTVPTPVDLAHVPDLSPLISASKIVGRNIKAQDIVVFESTVYPGCTEEICIPELEATSGLKAGVDFFVGYSPERINPGDTENTLSSMTKIVSAQTPESLAIVAKTYGLLNDGKIHRASNIKTAEAAKVIENTQRDLNIALMNELSMLFHRLDINTQEVLAAAGTKWNFLRFQPGLVGGHCIPVDPYYLTHKAEMVSYHPEIILAGRRINDQMARFVSFEVLKMLAKTGRSAPESTVLVLGATFKPDVRDLRNSQVFDLVKHLEEFGLKVDVYDPVPDQGALKHKGVSAVESPFDKKNNYNVVIFATPHRTFKVANSGDLELLLSQDSKGIVVDLSGKITPPTSSEHCFWQL